MEDKQRLEQFLRENRIGYEIHHHPEAYTAQEVAAVEHVPGRMFAKVVMVAGGDQLVMAVVPAPGEVDLDKVAAATGSSGTRLATEEEFGPLFPGSDVGAMSPFGNKTLYDVPVYVDDGLAGQRTIAFDACTHTDTVHMAYSDFEKLVEPTVTDLTKD
jgi:Ala-tRNA(Pro) deacylase